MPRLAVALVLLAGVVAALFPPAAAASSADDAKIERLVKDAQKAYDANDGKKSAELLLKAYEVKAVPKLLFNIARSFEKCGDEEQAIRYYERYVDAGDETALVRRASKALERLKELRDARLAADKKKQEDESRKTEQAKKEAEDAKASAQKAEADARARETAASAPPARARAAVSSGPSPVGFGLAGLAVVGLGVGIGFGVSANSSRSEYAAATDYAQKSELRSRTQQKALIADISYGVAGAAAIAAVIVLVVTTGRTDAQAGLEVGVGPGSVAVSGTWGP